MIITAGRLGEQPCWSEPRTRFSARTGTGLRRLDTSLLRDRLADCAQILGLATFLRAAAFGDRIHAGRPHVIGDHHRRAAGSATLLLTALDGIIGMHRRRGCPL